MVAPIHFLGWRALMKDPRFANADYLLPTPTKDARGFIPRPCTNAKASRWMRQIFAHMPDAPTAPVESPFRLTLPSWRVWAPDLAYQAQVPRTQRRYIGRWAEEANADVYTREHRTVISAIWKVISDQVQTAGPSRLVPEDLEHEAWDTTDALESPTAALGADEVAIFGDDGTVIPLPSHHAPPAPRRIPADKVKALAGGPLTVIRNSVKMKGFHKLHLLRTNLQCVGCGWRPKQHQYTQESKDDRLTATDVTECTPCFKLYTYPASRELPSI